MNMKAMPTPATAIAHQVCEAKGFFSTRRDNRAVSIGPIAMVMSTLATVVMVMASMKAVNITVLDVRGLTDVADTMIIIVRWVLTRDTLPERVGRVVMLAPPNQGAHAANTFTPWAGWLLRPMRSGFRLRRN